MTQVDMDTGEIFDPDVDLTLAASQLYEAKQQFDAWERHVNYLKSLFVAHQQEKNVIYGDVKVSVRQAVRTMFDVAAYKNSLIEGSLSAETLASMVEAATGFNPKYLPMITEPDRFVSNSLNKPYVVCDLILKNAPKEA